MEHDELLRETYRLTLENNKMLHRMRRNAFWGGLLKFIMYAAFLLVPVWLYMQYLAPVVDQMFKTAQQIQGTGAQASAQFTDLQNAWQQFSQKFNPSQP